MADALPLVTGREVSLNLLAALCHQSFCVESPFTGIDRFVDGKGDCARSDVISETGHTAETAVDSDGHHREFEFGGQHESAAFEGNHLTIPRATALREDHKRHSTAEFSLRVGNCLLDGVNV